MHQVLCNLHALQKKGQSGMCQGKKQTADQTQPNASNVSCLDHDLKLTGVATGMSEPEDVWPGCLYDLAMLLSRIVSH